MRIGLVLGAGGVQGGAWLTGALDALATETAWDPASAETIIGTSAGSMLGALLAGGVPPWFMVAHSAGETFEAVTDAAGRPAADADRSGGAVFKLEPWPPPIGPGSWQLALRALGRPHRFTPAAAVSGWVPRGMVSTEPLREQVRRVVPDGWGPHPGLWVVACDYATGRRVPSAGPAHRRLTSPTPSPPPARSPASTARSRSPGGSYVDGGMYSTSNLDLLRDDGLDLVICLNPTSSLHPIRAVDPREWGSLVFRRASGRRLGSEAKKLRSGGTPVVLVQPLGEDLRTMSRNLMSTRNRNEVIEVAQLTVAAQLADPEIAELLDGPAAGPP